MIKLIEYLKEIRCNITFIQYNILFDILNNIYDNILNLEPKSYADNFLPDFKQKVSTTSHLLQWNHVGFYIGDYHRKEDIIKFSEHLSKLLNEGKIHNLEYGMSKIAPKQYDTEGWWFTFEVNGKIVELFTYAYEKSWKKRSVENKVMLISHAAISVNNDQILRELYDSCMNSEKIKVIHFVEDDALHHSYMHLLANSLNKVIEFIYIPPKEAYNTKSENMKSIVVVGIGRMGACIVKRINRNYRLSLYDKKINIDILHLASEINAEVLYDKSNITNSDYIILAIPAKECVKFLESYKKLIPVNTIIICISTGLNEELAANLIKLNRICFIKIIGEAGEIERGNKPILVLQNRDYEEYQEQLEDIFFDFGSLIYSNNKIYSELNHMAAKESIIAINKVIEKLKPYNLPESTIETTINNVMTGTCRTYPWRAEDLFIQNVIKEINQKY